MSTTPGLEILAFLTGLGGLGTIYLGIMAATPNTLGALIEYGGLAPDYQFGTVGIKYETPALQLMFRGEPGNYSAPMAKARIAYKALAELQPGTISSGSAIYLTVKPQQAPFSLGQDSNLRYEVGFNLYCTKEIA